MKLLYAIAVLLPVLISAQKIVTPKKCAPKLTREKLDLPEYKNLKSRYLKLKLEKDNFERTKNQLGDVEEIILNNIGDLETIEEQIAGLGLQLTPKNL